MMAFVVNPDKEAAGDGTGPTENPCLRRLRHKRLLAFLQGQHYDGAFNALLHQAHEQFCLERMQLLVTEGLWEDAIDYLNSFLPTCLRSFGAQIFYNFLLMHYHIARLVAGHKDSLETIEDDKWMCVTDAVKSANQMVPSGMIRSVLLFDNVRKCMNWGGVRKYAAQAVKRLVSLTPELNRRLTLPVHHMMPHGVLPVGLGFSRRRHLKKQVPRVKSATVARVIRGSRRYIRFLNWSSFESFADAKECLTTFIGDSLEGGLHTGCYVLHSSRNEGDLTHPIWKVTSCVESSEVTTMVNAGTEKSQEGCYTKIENARLVPRKNPRAEQEIIEDFLGTKKQRTAGAFGSMDNSLSQEIEYIVASKT